MNTKNGHRSALVLALVFTLVLTILGGCTAVSAQTAAAKPTDAGSGKVSAAVNDPDAVTVSTVDELLTAIAPGAAVILEPGTYDLSTATSYGKDDSGSRYFGWQGVDDGQFQLSITGLSDLTLSAASKDSVTITNTGEYAPLFFFESCEHITLTNIALGRAEDSNGLGQPVLSVYNSGDIRIDGCSLYNGRIALLSNNVRSLRVQDTVIYDCDDSAAILQGCMDVLFDGCKIYDCGKDESDASLLRFQSCNDAAVINSDIYDNENIWMLNSSLSTELYLGGLDVRQNEFQRMFFLTGETITVDGCAFTDNNMYAWYEGTDMDASQQRAVSAVSPEGEELTGAMLADMELIRPVKRETKASATPPAQELKSGKNGEISVSSVDELLAAIAPNTSIFLEPGIYDLSTATGFGSAGGSKYYRWEQCYDGAELCITDVENLMISSADPEGVTISAKPRYADVISFDDCDGLRLENITMGHTEEPGACSGGVLYLSDCDGAALDNLRLYGCGIIGITAIHCDELTVKNSEIFDCSYGAVSVDGSRGVLFDNCDIYDCSVIMSGLINFTGCEDCAYINSELNRNSGMGLIYSSYSQDIYLASLDVHDNTFDRMFYFDPYSPVINGCAFSENIVPDDWYGSKYEPVNSAKALDQSGRKLDKDELLTMSLGGKADWTAKPPEAKPSTPAPAAGEDGAIHVKTVDELLNAIAPNATIYLEAGLYDLYRATGYGSASSEYYSWVQDYDGPELVISDVENLTITGAGADKVTISAQPRYADVLCFIDCDNVSLAGFTAGHTEDPGSCSGGVLYFDDCDDVSITECALFGCGILGITGYDCEDMTVSKTEIYDCSLGGVSFNRCGSVAMVGCDLHDNGGPDYSHYMCTNMTVDGKSMPSA